MAELLLINGPNLNRLGSREPSLYGTATLPDIEKRLTKIATDSGHRLHSFQSNAEHALVERVHQAADDNMDFILINPAALTHTSVALRDALLAADIPFIELHLSNIHAREAFRQHSYLSDIARGVISGFGPYSYELALAAALRELGAN